MSVDSGVHGNELIDVFKILEILTSPQSTGIGATFIGKHKNHTQFEILLATNIQRARDEIYTKKFLLNSLQTSSHYDVIFTDGMDDKLWQFTVFCVELLNVLSINLHNEVNIKDVDEKKEDDTNVRERLTEHVAGTHHPKKLPRENGNEYKDTNTGIQILSLGQQNIILCTMQFITCFGVYPNLQPGVGIPLMLKSQFAQSILSNIETNSKESKPIKLLYLARCFMAYIRNSSLSALILSKHLSDILCTVMQLGYGILSKCSNGKSLSNIADSCSQDIVDVEFWRNELFFIVSRVYKPLLVKELLLLQGGPNPKVLKKELNIPENINKASVLPIAPTWLKNCCGQLLTHILLGDTGLHDIVQGMLGDDIIVDSATEINWRKYDAVSKVIANCPQQIQSLETYFEKIGQQILQLLHERNSRAWRHYIRVCSGVVTQLTLRNFDLSAKLIINPIISPLFFPDCKIVTKENLAQSIEDIYQIFVLGEMKSDLVLSHLEPIVISLFKMYSFTLCHPTKISYRSWLVAILSSYIKHRDSTPAVKCIVTCLTAAATEVDQTTDAPHLTFTTDENGAVLVNSNPPLMTDIDQLGHMTNYISSALHLMDQFHDSYLIEMVFLDLLKKVETMISSAIEAQKDVIATNDVDWLVSSTPFYNLSILNSISAICERFEIACLKNTLHIIDFVQITLERCLLIRTLTEASEFSLEHETRYLSIGLLISVLSNGTKFTEDETSKLEELLPLLEKIKTTCSDEKISELIEAVRVAIATHGYVLDESVFKQKSSKSKISTESLDIGSTSENGEVILGKAVKASLLTGSTAGGTSGTDVVNDPRDLKGSRLITELSAENRCSASDLTNVHGLTSGDKKSIETGRNSKTNPQTEKSQDVEHLCTPSTTQKYDLDSALELINDDAVPTKGHGLIQLSRLIDSRDEKTLQNQPRITCLLLSHLSHEDSYVYLAAIRCLSALADKFPKEVILGIVENLHGYSIFAEYSLKLGEVLVKAVRNLGDLVPAYKGVVLPAILRGVKSYDPLIRASSLSNLAEICKLLRFSLSSHLHEILTCTSSIIKSETDAEVRKAGAFLLSLIIEGAGQDLFEIIGDSIQDIYRLLKLAVSTETDDIVLFHLHTCLKHLDVTVKKFLFPAQRLEKKISILDYR